MQTKVVKFGGSSLADAAQFKKVAEIILSDTSRRFVVPSAPGKRFPTDSKVTDMLYACYEKASCGDDITSEFSKITERYNNIISDLNLSITLADEFANINHSFISKAGRDYAASRGEYLNGIILAAYLNFTFLDAAEYIFFNDNGTLNSEKTNAVLAAKLKTLSNAVIPGFYGSMPNDTIKTFSRGGSDITGSIVARAVNASVYENWTDVSGFLIADPRIVENPQAITHITYKELRELAYMGATVLHEEAIFPVRTAGIPINIRNTNNPDEPGTIISSDVQAESSKYIITGIAGRKGFSVINIEKDMMNDLLGFARKILKVLEQNQVSFEHLPSGIDTMGIVVVKDQIKGKEERIIAAITEKISPDHIELEEDIALIAVVGRGMRSTRGTAARVFAALAHAHINIKLIDQGSSELNIIVGVSEKDFENATRSIYDVFVN